MITRDIKKQIVEAMKSRDEIRLSTLRLLSSELHNAKIDKRGDLTKEEELIVVRREAKKRKDAIEAYKKAEAKEREEKEKKELVILKEYLPKEMSDDELEKIVAEAIKISGVEDIKEMGKVMGIAVAKTKGQVEGGRIAALVEAILS